MSSALIVRFRPSGPWRFGPENGARDRVDRVFHSDSLYSALTIAMRHLGFLDEWLDATAHTASPAIRLSSCYPYVRRTLLVQPPRHVWPPAQTGKLRWKAARFVPLSLVNALLRGEELNEDQWAVEPASGCLLPVEKNAVPNVPFRIAHRRFSPVDRVNGASESAISTACLEFANQAGMWFTAVFADDAARTAWRDRLRGAVRLLADSGIGGERSKGWGRSAPPAFEDVRFPEFLTPAAESNGGEKAWWMLSLFSPSDSDAVDWERGNYDVVNRSGRVDVAGSLKPAVRMITEGSVVLSPSAPSGVVREVPPGSAGHPVFRSGLALAVPVSWHESRRLSWLAATAEPKPAAPSPEQQAEAELEAPPEPVAVTAEIAPVLTAEAEVLAEPEAGPVPEVEQLQPEPEAAEAPPAEPVAAEAVPAEPVAGEPPEPPVPAEEPPSEEPPVEPPPSEEPPVREPDPEQPPIQAPPDEDSEENRS